MNIFWHVNNIEELKKLICLLFSSFYHSIFKLFQKQKSNKKVVHLFIEFVVIYLI